MPTPQQLIIKVLSYNQGNANLSQAAVHSLRTNLEEENGQADIIIIGGQEAKQTWGKNLAERLLPEDYVLLHKDYFNVWTKPAEGMAQTDLSILVKKDLINQVGYSKSGMQRQNNKGGLFTTLNVCGQEIDIVNVHLDSFNEQKRQRQMQGLLDKLPKSEDSKSRNQIILGDFNTGRVPVYPEAESVQKEKAGLRKEIIEKVSDYNLLVKNSNEIGLSGFKFDNTAATYEKKDQSGNIKENKARERYDIGVLDGIGSRGETLVLQKTKVIEPSQGNQLAQNDHKPVMSTLVLKLPAQTLKERLLNHLCAKIKQKDFFHFSFGYSSYEVTIDNQRYRVPRRVSGLYKLLSNDAQLSKENLVMQITNIIKSKNTNSVFGKTRSSTEEYLEWFLQEAKNHEQEEAENHQQVNAPGRNFFDQEIKTSQDNQVNEKNFTIPQQ